MFNGVSEVAVDGNGAIYVADVDNHRIEKFQLSATPARPSTWGRLKHGRR